ncbi:MAG: hypothetical protein WBD40_16870 [Tepidisphaeraceae bacterium]
MLIDSQPSLPGGPASMRNVEAGRIVIFGWREDLATPCRAETPEPVPAGVREQWVPQSEGPTC